MVSIVVPAHNVEKYICDCLNSLINQSYRDLEIIVIDDGSTDTTGKLCDSFAEKDCRIKIVHKKQGGVSSARNLGIALASGEWITFVDSDDWLKQDIIAKMMPALKNDLLNCFGYDVVDVNGLYAEKEAFYTGELSREELIANVVYLCDEKYNLGNFYRAIWGKLLRTDIIKNNDIRFSEDLTMGEDALFLVQYLQFVKGLNFISQDGYNYRQISSSVTHRFKEKLYIYNDNQYRELKKELQKNDLIDNAYIRISMVNFRWWMFTSLIENSLNGVREKKIQPQKIFLDAIKWFNNYISEMRQSVENIERINDKFVELYQNRQRNAYYLCFFFLYIKFKRKLFAKDMGQKWR